MDTIVLKFGGSSVADNIKLNLVADKIKEFYNNNQRVVAVVSAQGKTTDNLIKEAATLSNMPNEREMDVLLSTGEQVSMAKLSILLNRDNVPTISLTGWQAGIKTNNTNQDAIIEDIDTTRIKQELDQGKVVIVAGFQGINEKGDITTLGRGGSDTTAVAIAAKIKADHCYIFSDVDGIYTTDPNQVTIAKKIDSLSYQEMLDIADEGAKVLHNRCVEVGEKFGVPIIAKSTFKEGKGTEINNKPVEGILIKNIVKNDKLIYVHGVSKKYSTQDFNSIYNKFVINEIGVKNLINNSDKNLDMSFTISKDKFSKFTNLLETELQNLDCTYKEITRISIIGNGIMSNNSVLKNVMNILDEEKAEILSMEVAESKISIMFKEIVSNDILQKLHKELIK
ncbi:MAG: aspartate kinase [Clostridia bacterium]|nr:aspartate kinase [Clostridia bacterium]